MVETFSITQISEVEAELFYNPSMAIALVDVEGSDFQPQYMPGVINARINAPGESLLWKKWISTLSIRATGRTKSEVPVVVYAHVPNYFSQANNITEAIKQGLVNGAGKLPKSEFQRLLDLQDNKRVFVVDYKTLMRSTAGLISINKALEHPQTIPFLGGRERAETYLLKHERTFGKKIGTWYTDDLCDEPLARLLYVGDDYDGLGGYGSLDDDGQFLGVRVAGEASAPKSSPSQEQLKKLIEEYVAPVNHPSLMERLDALYK